MHLIYVISCSCLAGTTKITVPKFEMGGLSDLKCFAITIRELLSGKEVAVGFKNVEKVPYNSDRPIQFSSYRRQAKRTR